MQHVQRNLQFLFDEKDLVDSTTKFYKFINFLSYYISLKDKRKSESPCKRKRKHQTSTEDETGRRMATLIC